jgi:GSH-dependent disulfide-bond oxidoreductase
MIDFYTWATPNGRKIGIMLEEARLDYVAKPINLEMGEQYSAAFLKVSPNNKIPAIVDHDVPGGLAVFESGAILIYLAEKTGQFLPKAEPERSRCLQWLFWQVSGLGPMVGQFNNFRHEPEGDKARERFTEEALRLFAILDKQLGESEFLAGPYTIADMATYPWTVAYRHRVEKALNREFKNIDRWEKAVAMRPAVGRGMGTPAI